MNSAQRTTVFVMYSRDGEAHEKWVADLAIRLDEEPDLDVTYDGFEIYGGADLTPFMERVRSSERAIAVITPTYVERAEGRIGGVGYEAGMVTAELMKRQFIDKFVPVLRSGDAVPSYLESKTRIDFRDDSLHDEKVQELLDALRRKPPVPRPPKRAARTDATVTRPSARSEPPSGLEGPPARAFPRPRVRMGLAIDDPPRSVSSRDFIRGLDVSFARLQNTGDEEAFHIIVRVDGVPNLDISARVDHLAAREHVTLRHRDLHFVSDGKNLGRMNLWWQLLTMNAVSTAEPIGSALTAIVEYDDAFGDHFETRYDLSNGAFTFKGDLFRGGSGIDPISGSTEDAEVAALRQQLAELSPRMLTSHQAAIIRKHLEPLVQKEKVRSATGASVSIHVDPGGGCGDCGTYALQFEKLFLELGFRIMGTSLSEYRDDSSGEYDDYRDGITIRRDTRWYDRTGAQKFGDAFAAALDECKINARLLERDGAFFDVIIGYKDRG